MPEHRYTWEHHTPLELIDPPTIPDHLVTFNPDDWPGREPGHVMSHDILVKREHWRRAQDQWADQHRLGRQGFEQLWADRLRALQQEQANG